RKDIFDRIRVQELKDEVQGKAVLFPEGNHYAVIRRRGLQFKIECPAEALSQRESPGTVDACAERCMHHELHSATFIEETFGHDSAVAGQRAKSSSSCTHVQRRLLCASTIECAFMHQPVDRVVLVENVGTQSANLFREFKRTAWGFTAPEGDRWCGAVR